MTNIRDKLVKICGELLINGKGVKSISQPLFGEEIVTIEFSNGGNVDWIEIPYTALANIHDYTLDAYLLNIFKEHNLL